MNTAQRKFLIERIQQKVKDKIEQLKSSLKEYPSASNYIFKSIMNDQLELQPKEVILNALKQKALKSKEGENWLSNERMGFNKERTIRMLIEELIVIPEDYKKELELVRSYNKGIRD